MKRKSAALGLGLILICVIGVLLAPSIMKLSLISPGWEIYNQVGAIRSSDTILSQSSQFTSPRELMGSYWKVDVDDPAWGVATLMVSLTEIRHVDLSGRDLPAEQYVETRTVVRGNDTFYLDYHIYLYTVTIRTIADAINDGGSPPWSAPTFDHETSWPYQFRTSLGTGGTIDNPPHVGTKFLGGTYVKFVISPWRGASYRNPPDGYVLNNCWSGVMNTYVNYKTEGQVDNAWGDRPTPDGSAPTNVKGGLNRGDQVPMFEDDGTFGTSAPTVGWDSSLTPDPRIKSTVVQYFPVEINAGAMLSSNPYGQVSSVYPCDVAVQYEVRIDVLQQHEFTLQTAYKPPEPTWPSDYFSWAQDFWTSFLQGIDPFKIFGPLEPFVWFLFTLFVIGVIIFIVLAIFAPWALPRIFGGVRESAKALRGKNG